MTDLILGAGGGGKGGDSGGGGSQHTPTEAANSLFSTSYAKLIDLISEGEIYGLVNGLKSVYVDNTPLQNADGSYNFQNVTVYTKTGTQSQAYIPGFDDIANEVSVGTTVTASTPIVRTITNTAVNAARVTVTVPQLQQYTDQGDINGASVNLWIAVQYNGGGFTTVIDDTISGRTGQQYQKQYSVNLSGAFPIDIRVTRVTADSGSSKLINAFSWTSYTEVTYAKLAYPNSALVGVRIDAEQFSNIPSRSYRVRGIKVKIPSNGTVNSTTGAISYTGIWDGTFGAAQWTSDPAWCLWDLLTSTRYGFGNHIDTTQLDKWAFYSASQYCGASVPDGFGGTEPRFSCNVNIQTADDAYKLINDMASVFRAMPYWSTGALTVAQDKPSDPAYLFTYANVSEEGFSYSGSSLKTRPTVAVVQYMDLSLRNVSYEVVENQTAISKYGVIKTDITAFACTSRGQAHRIGEWLLYSSQYETETVTFMASIDAGVVVRPGQIIEISDPVRAGARRGGRIKSATTTAITVDDATGLSATNTPTLSVILSDGTVQTRSVSSVVGNVVTVSSKFISTPNVNSVWIFENTTIQATTWRVLGVQEQDQCKYAITALAYNASKYDYIERGVTLQTRTVSTLNVIPAAPTNLGASETLYETNGRAAAKIIVTWQPIAGVSQYRFRWRQQNGNWNNETIQRSDYEILDTSAGNYEIQVYSLNAALNQSVQPAALNFAAYGKTAPPSDVTGLSLIPIDSASAVFSWNPAPDIDVRLGGKVLIRHSVLTSGAVWEQAQELVPSASGNQTQKQVPLLTGTVLVKFEDDSGNRSVNATSVIVTLPTPQPRYTVTTYAEDAESPPFTGNYTNMVYMSELGGIILASGTNVDDMATDGNWDALASIDSIGGVVSSGEYDFGSTYDMGATFDVNLTRRFTSRPYLPASLWDDKLDLIDDWSRIDETNLDGVNATLYVRSTTDDPAGTPTWSNWREFANAIVKARGFQFKVLAESTDTSQNIIIDQLGATLELQQRTEQSGTLTSTAGTYSVTFGNAFYQAPTLGLTAFNMATGDYWSIASVTTTGFQVTFRNSAGTAVSRQFTYNAVGYGKAG
jgi:hypothetical protein